jgi:hypothetical protein
VCCAIFNCYSVGTENAVQTLGSNKCASDVSQSAFLFGCVVSANISEGDEVDVVVFCRFSDQTSFDHLPNTLSDGLVKDFDLLVRYTEFIADSFGSTFYLFKLDG